MAKAKTGRDLAREKCNAYPDAPSRQLARMLYDENLERFPNLESARTAIRAIRGAMGRKDRKPGQVTHPRQKQKAGWKPECPPSLSEEWMPVQIDGPAKVFVFSDVHLPFHSKEAVESAISYGRKLKPDVVVLLGDIADFYNISRWEKDPKLRDFRAEIESVKQFLEWIRGKFPKARLIYKFGNHECRYDKFIYNKAPELWNLEALQMHNILEFEQLGIERVDDQVIMAGQLAMLHGHETGKSLSAPVNPARGLFLRTKHTALIGHLHQTSGHGESNMWHDETFCWSIGALCTLNPPYLRINRWNHGACAVDVSSDGQFDVHNFRISSDYRVRAS